MKSMLTSFRTSSVIDTSECVRNYTCSVCKIIYILIFLLKVLLWMQHTSISPDRKLLTVVGDDRDGLLVDARNGKVLKSLTDENLPR